MIALSTAFPKAMIALEIDGKQDFQVLDVSCKQAENILKAIDSLLDKNDFAIQDNDVFAVVVGPGSFTGLRIGTALVKGFCAGLDQVCKVVPISSLDLLAFEYVKQNKPESDFACVINALSGLYFVCQYHANGEKKGEEALVDSEQYKLLNLEKIGIKGENVANIEIELCAESLLEYANILARSGKFCDFHTLSPVYLRKSQAEDALDQKNLKKS